jgi:hypothetical protein
VAPGPPAGSISGYAEPFYGTMSGPWWYHTATSVPRVLNPPFSLLRMLIQVSRKPPRKEGRRQTTLRSAATQNGNGECRKATAKRRNLEVLCSRSGICGVGRPLDLPGKPQHQAGDDGEAAQELPPMQFLTDPKHGDGHPENRLGEDRKQVLTLV